MTRIEEKIEKYLMGEKVSREEAFEKWKKVLYSAKTLEQLNVAFNMARNYYKMYGEEWTTKVLDFLTLLKPNASHSELKRVASHLDNRLDQLTFLKIISKKNENFNTLYSKLKEK